jgi:hypothetical protein
MADRLCCRRLGLPPAVPSQAPARRRHPACDSACHVSASSGVPSGHRPPCCTIRDLLAVCDHCLGGIPVTWPEVGRDGGYRTVPAMSPPPSRHGISLSPRAGPPARSAAEPGTLGTNRSKNPISQACSQRLQETLSRSLTTSSYAGVGRGKSLIIVPRRHGGRGFTYTA